jgi:hypothetical protein
MQPLNEEEKAEILAGVEGIGPEDIALYESDLARRLYLKGQSESSEEADQIRLRLDDTLSIASVASHSPLESAPDTGKLQRIRHFFNQRGAVLATLPKP